MTDKTKFDNMSIVTALIHVIKQSLNSHLSDEFWQKCETHLAYLRTQLGLTNIQIVFVSMLIDRNDVMSWSDFALYLDITNFEARTHANELDELVKKGWLTLSDNILRDDKGFELVPEAENALINNQVFVPKEPTDVTEEKTIDDDDDDNDIEEDNHHCCNYNSTENSYAPTLKFYADIHKKKLFFNPEEQQQIQRLTQMLSSKKFHSIQRRLTAQGMRKGVVFLLHGGPGTGKTETVLQLARQTGRDILQVDIAGLRTKWVGESLKNIKSVFRTYRGICDAYEDVPILFFNEADGIFSKRSTRPQQYCDKEENAMQNVILQEMEDFDGILIATTNLACNMDEAFERRFLYKIELKKPERDVRAKIWSSMLKNLNKNDALTLASHFDFSGAQIENIARKRIIDYILTGRYPSLNEIEAFCRSEILDSKKECHHIVGFAL
jgi:hypothetical protein